MCAEELTNQVLYMRNVPANDKDVWMSFEAIEDGQLGETDGYFLFFFCDLSCNTGEKYLHHRYDTAIFCLPLKINTNRPITVLSI